jgi:hypothetical protein
MDSLEQEVRFRYEVRVEYGNEITLGALETRRKRSRLVTQSGDPGVMVNIESPESILIDLSSRNVDGLVCRVVEHLDLEEVAGIVESGDRIDEALDDVDLVENGQLYSNPRKGCQLSFDPWLAMSIPVI